MIGSALARWRRGVVPALAAAVAAWGAYAVMEVFWSSVVPWLAGPRELYRPVHPHVTLMALALFISIGLAVGAALSVIGERPAHVMRGLALASLAGVFTLNASQSISANGMIAVVVTGALVTIGALISCVLPRRAAALADPWIASTILLAAATAGSELADRGAGVPRLLLVNIVLVAAGVAVLVILVRRFMPKPRVFAGLASLAVVAAALMLDQRPLQAPRSSAAERGGMNVILIVLDTLRADHTSLYGYSRKTSPNLEALAREATLYPNSISASDMTLASHASMFTGLYAATHGSHGNSQKPLAPEFPTLAAILKRHGWRTEAVIANHTYLSPVYGMARGFTYYDVRVPVSYTAEPPRAFLRERLRNQLLKMKVESPAAAAYRTADIITAEALARVEAAAGERFFLFLNYMEPHYPYHAPAPYDGLYPGKDPGFSKAQFHDVRRAVLSKQRSITPSERAHLGSQYDGAITYLDTQLARLFEGLRRLNRFDDTLLILTADHGEAFGEHDLIEHAVSVRQESIHVPLLIRYPRQRQGRVDGRLASGVDLLPTILAEAGLPIPSRTEGRALQGPAVERNIFAESYPTPETIVAYPRFHLHGRAMLRGTFKLLTDTEGTVGLYDLARDPREENALGDDSTRTSFLQILDSRFRPHSLSTVSARRDAETERRLRSLGYLQ